MKQTLWMLFFALFSLMGFTSCSETENENTEFANWKSRNASYFSQKRTDALSAITDAKTAHGDNWQDNCSWRTYLSYSLVDTVKHESTDSVYAEIIKRGTGTVSPFSSDSVRINYRAYLIPSASYENGYIISYSGQSSAYDKVFDHNTATPSAFKVSGVIRGLATALQHMHVGDLWRVYIPHPLAYGTSDSGTVPGYSVLIYEVELCAFYRNGTPTGGWQ